MHRNNRLTPFCAILATLGSVAYYFFVHSCNAGKRCLLLFCAILATLGSVAYYLVCIREKGTGKVWEYPVESMGIVR